MEQHPHRIQSYFFRLPLELRQQIYRYILPSSAAICSKTPPKKSGEVDRDLSLEIVDPVRFLLNGMRLPSRSDHAQDKSRQDIVWCRGCIAILAVNHQIHEECADIMYGSNTFVVNVRYDGILFKYKWLLPSNLTPSLDFSFLEHFSQRNLRRIRYYKVTVEHVDSYTGMVKFNCGGSGLTPGLQSQVERLVDVMKLSSEIRSLHVNLKDGSKSRNSTARGQMYPIPPRNSSLNPQSVLQPFMRLRGLRHFVIEGAVSADFSEELEKKITLPQESRE